MIKKIFILFSIFGLLIIQSCKNNTLVKDQITLNIGSEPQTLDPRKVRDINSINIAKTLFDGLMRASKDGSVQCAIADRYVIDADGKQYTFFLKESFWSNGEKLTAYDFEYSYKKALSIDFVSPYAFNLFVIKNAKLAKAGKISSDEIGIKALDEKTLVIQLENPCPYFLNLLTMPIFFAVNKDIDQRNPNWFLDDKEFVSNGAFKLSRFKHSDYIEAKKNDLYWDAKIVKLKKIKMLMMTPDAELGMFEMNKLDIAGSPFSTLTVDSLKKLKNDKNFCILPFYGTSFIRVNTLKINDPHFRKALVNGFDRKKIIEHILQGGQKQSTKLVPTDETFDIPIIKDDFASKTVTISYISSDRAHILAQALQRDLEDNLKIKVKLQALERKTFLDRLGSLDYELALSSWIADFDDPIDFLNVFKYKDSSTNNTGWENNKYTDLLEKSEITVDKCKRDKILVEAENILLNDAPIIPICHLAQNLLKKESIKDLFIYPNGFIDFKYAYFE
ncbi:MAG: peptide ABC transporter substrate-binding protein [Parachlamydiales bacterium]|jgi:oligopeptide transport system substrate-binding protein